MHVTSTWVTEVYDKSRTECGIFIDASMKKPRNPEERSVKPKDNGDS